MPLPSPRTLEFLDGDVSTWDMEKKEQTFLREKKHADFKAAHEEYSESIDAVGRAVEEIEAGPKTGFLQTSLLELSAKSVVPADKRKLIMSFLQRPRNPEEALMQDAQEVTAP